MVVIAGEGPRANGIPEMYYPSEYLNRDPLLRWITALITDGRYSGATYGPCIGHASPEALAGGLIGAIATGDAIYLDFHRGRIDLLDKARSLGGPAPRRARLGAREIRTRPVLAERVRALAERRREIPPSIRALLDGLSSSMEGCVPIGMLDPEPKSSPRS
jgi:dihydroxyacid dehydratase/phosphogluconate dehydratase